METPGYETGEPYPFASETSDPSGLGATFNSIVWATDPASKFSLQLQDRWVSTKEWDYWPPARIIAVIVASLHLALSAVNITAHLFHEFPLIVWDAWDKYKRELDGQVGGGARFICSAPDIFDPSGTLSAGRDGRLRQRRRRRSWRTARSCARSARARPS
eukprot:138591-Rhodomonas_salina.4